MATYREEGPLYREDGTPVYPDGRPATYADDRPVVVERRRGGGGFFTGLILLLLIIAGVLFYTGFWHVNVTNPGELPKISVSNGSLPKVDLESKKIVIDSKKEEVAVPTVGVKDAKSNDDN